ncbi:uncharacterized protein LOC126106787 isoform X2 [Schistocerca cancellata]|uniref:uncharacterized protein LOC126106787 isoform X2 n=1 Tax=Schistocerca cancellata TaxID=274614 RepID=UPI002117CDE4|nr:uncharacterized protein LOC126106787 isoform X2 [Schistocerca cancellata]
MVTEFSSVFSVFSSTQGGRLETGEGCAHSQLPTVEEFYSNLTPLLSVAIAVSTAAVVSVCVTYTLSLRHVLTRTAPQLRSHTAWVLTIHPVAAVLAYLSVMIPRASFLVDVGIQDLYATCLYQMFCLLVAYCEQEGSTDQLHGAMIQLNTGPLCCLPGCHWFCRPVPLTRKTLLQLRILVLQLPIAMWILYTVCYVLWAEDEWGRTCLPCWNWWRSACGPIGYTAQMRPHLTIWKRNRSPTSWGWPLVRQLQPSRTARHERTAHFHCLQYELTDDLLQVVSDGPGRTMLEDILPLYCLQEAQAAGRCH